MDQTIQALQGVRDAAVELYSKHSKFWQDIAFNPAGGLDPNLIGALSVSEGPARQAMQEAIRQAEDALVAAGVPVERTAFDQIIAS